MLGHTQKVILAPHDRVRRIRTYGCLGDAFMPQVKDAWIVVYTLLANTMKDAAKAQAAA